jgi:fatty acid desaturase
MATTFQKTVAFIVVVTFFMMIIGPLASLLTWIVGLIVALVLVPVIVLAALWYSKGKAEPHKDGLLEEVGLTEEEWTEEQDDDDFEGEVD